MMRISIDSKALGLAMTMSLGLASCVAHAQTFTVPAAATSTQTTLFGSLVQTQSVAVDPAGDVFYTQPNQDNAGDGGFFEQPASGGAAITLIASPTLSYPKGVAADANYGYTSDYHGHLWRVPIGGGAAVDILTACNNLDNGYLGTQDVAVDGSGDVFTASSNETGLFEITAAGVCSIVPNVTLDSSSHVAVDSAGDIAYSTGGKLYSLPKSATTPVVVAATLTAINGLRSDTYGNVFVSTTATIVEVPFLNGALSAADEFNVLPSSSSADIGIGADGSLYTTDGTNMHRNFVGAVRFPSTAVGSTTAAQTLNVIFNSAQTLTSIRYAEGPGTSTEIINTGGTCAAGAHTAGATCTIVLTAKPTNIGTRSEAVVLSSVTGVIGMAAVAVEGSGAGLVADPGTQMALGSGFTAPDGVAVDAAADVFVADQSAGTVSYLPAGGGAAAVIATGLSSPAGLAVGGDGTVYVANTGANNVVRIPYTGTAYGEVAVAVSGLSAPSVVAISPTGNLYIANTAAGTVLSVPNQAGFLNFSDSASVGSGFKTPDGLAFDSAGDLFVADSTADTVTKVAGGSTIIANGLTAPGAIALDDSETLYILQGGLATIRRIPFTGGAFSANGSTLLGTGLTAPASLALDNAGNLYIADSGAANVVELERTSASLNFGSINLKAPSSSESFVFSDDGDTSTTFGSPLYTASGDTGDFAVTSSGANACSGGGVLTAGSSCDVSGTFTPTMSGVRSETLTVSSNAVNASPVTATLTGTGVNLQNTSVTLTQVSPTGTVTFGQTVTVSATVTAAAGSTGTPTGSVQFAVNGTAYGAPVPLNTNDNASINISGLAAGTNTVSATYSGDTNFASSSANPPLTVVVGLAPTMTTLTSTVNSNTPVQPGTSVTLAATVTTSVTSSEPTGTVTFSTSGGITLATVALGTNGVATYTTTTLPDGTHSIIATYSGDTGFATSTSNSVEVAIILPGFVVSNIPSSVTVNAPGSASTTFMVSAISGYTGTVDMACSGLPANTQCSFIPGVVDLINTTSASGATVPPSPQNVTLTLTTDTPPRSTVAWVFPLGAVMLLGFWSMRRRLPAYRLLGALILTAGSGLALLSLNGCGGTHVITPHGTSTVTVTLVGTANGPIAVPTSGTSNLPPQTFTFTLTVK